MKLCYFDDYRLGVIKGDNVVDITDTVKDIPHLHNRDLIIGLIDKWDSYKAKVEKAAADGKGVPLKGVRFDFQQAADIVRAHGALIEDDQL